MEFADMHCHVLPGVDDGAANKEEAFEMLRIAYKDGVRHIIATPHYHIGRMKAKAEDVRQRVQDLQQAALVLFPNLKIYSGQEIYYYSDAVKALKAGKALTMAGSRYVLLEYSTTVSFNEIRDSIYEMVTEGYIPVIAHVERYGSLYDEGDRVGRLVEDGAYIQVNAGSITGKSGGTAKKFVRKLLKDGLVHLVGTDAHDRTKRVPHIAEAAKYVSGKINAEYAEKIFYKNTCLIIQDEYI